MAFSNKISQKIIFMPNFLLLITISRISSQVTNDGRKPPTTFLKWPTLRSKDLVLLLKDTKVHLTCILLYIINYRLSTLILSFGPLWPKQVVMQPTFLPLWILEPLMYSKMISNKPSKNHQETLHYINIYWSMIYFQVIE